MWLLAFLAEYRAYLINAGIAALLGAGTNWLALRIVLYRTLPKKKHQFAQRIQHVVAAELMTPDKILRQLDMPQTADMLRENIHAAVTDFLARPLPPPASLFGADTAWYDRIRAALRALLLREMEDKAQDPEFLEQVLVPFVRTAMESIKTRAPADFVFADGSAFGDLVEQWVRSLKDSASLQNSVRDAIEAYIQNRLDAVRCLGDLVPGRFVEMCRTLLQTQTPFIAAHLAQMLEDGAIHDRLTKIIMASVNAQLRRQGFMGDIKGFFVEALSIENDVKNICRGLPEQMRGHFSDPQNSAELTRMFESAMDAALKGPVPDELRNPDRVRALTLMIFDSIWTADAFAEMGRRLRPKAEEYVHKPLAQTLRRVGVADAADTAVPELARRIQSVLAGPRLREAAATRLDALLDALRDKPIGRPDRFISPAAAQSLSSLICAEMRSLLRGRMAEMMDRSGAWNIIADSINAYGDREIAQLITGIAGNELRWNTYLGGLIGCVIGLVQTCLQRAGWW